MELETVIGLEVHLQLSTASKAFCSCPNPASNEAAAPNTLTCPVCLGLPGTLPVPNERAVELGLRLAAALEAEVELHSRFDRKNYTYPDLPKGYQITQFHVPLARHGRLVYELAGEEHALRLTEMHLEEDTGKLTHAGGTTFVDYNRAGAPLLEMVFEPDLRGPAAARAAVAELRAIARALGASDADMERAHLRCDANVSLRLVGSAELLPKVEVKNLNSLRSIQRALEHEVQRQTKLWAAGTPPTVAETRGWDERQQVTVSQRTKEGRHDYRYFPEPDLPPLEITAETVAAVRAALPPLPHERRRRLCDEYGLAAGTASLLVDRDVDGYFEQVISEGREWLTSRLAEGTSAEEWAKHGPKLMKLAVSWLDELENHLVAASSGQRPSPEQFAEFLTLVFERRVTSTVAQQVLRALVEHGGNPIDIVEQGGLGQVDDAASLGSIVGAVLAEHGSAAADFKAGKQNALKFLVGAAMKASGGKANPEQLRQMLVERLGGA